MLSLIYNAIQYTLNYIYSNETTEDINKIISRIESKDSNIIIKTDKTLNEEGCYYRTGNITYIAADYVLIDNDLIYEKNNDLDINLKIGDKVYYLAYLRNSDAEPKVRKIISVIDDESWDGNVNIKLRKDIHNHMMQRSIIARVTKRENRIAVVEPNNIRIDLSKVQSNFIPLVGDWLILESMVELNNNSIDLSGEILEVDKIKPLRSKLNVGVISKYTSNVGIIDRQVIFHKHACEPGYIPCVGDKVVSDSIESDQGNTLGDR